MSQTFILQELFSQDLPFRVHNVKIDTLLCQKDLPMMFLAHYDSLPDDIKAAKPLNLDLLKHMNDKVSADQACQLLGLPLGTIKPATHIKIIGTSVLVLDELPLAIHLQFTNTAKENQPLYGDNLQTLVQEEAKRYLLCGNVHILHKNPTNTLVSIDLEDNEFTIHTNDNYTRLPNAHALATTQTLNTLKNNTPQSLDYLTLAIDDKVMAHFAQTMM